jgi:hypothetical protein
MPTELNAGWPLDDLLSLKTDQPWQKFNSLPGRPNDGRRGSMVLGYGKEDGWIVP